MRSVTAATAACLLALVHVGSVDAADFILSRTVSGDRATIQVNKRSSDPSKHSIQYSAKASAILFTPGSGSVDDPPTNGATAVVFSDTDCQCLTMESAPTVIPGWTPLPSSGTPVKYKWKDDATRSTAQVTNGKIKLKMRGGITYGLDASPQDEVELHVVFGDSADRFCSRLRPPSTRNDTPTKYRGTLPTPGYSACSDLPPHCPCAPPPTSTSTSTSTTSSSTSTTESTTSTSTSTSTTSSSSTTSTTSTSSTSSTSSSSTSTTSSTVPPTTCPLPATGQTMCWNAAGTAIACAGTGQDGEVQKGSPLSFTDNGDGTITDNNTGLVWEKKSDDGGVHDRDTLHNWSNAFASHVATLNSTSFAGFNDWRVPNARELESVVYYQSANPALSPAFNSGCVPGCSVLTCDCNQQNWWSSTTGIPPNPATQAWLLISPAGTLDANSSLAKSNGTSVGVRAVRGGNGCLPATGQTTCWNGSGTVVPCAGTGQDGELQEGAPLSYTDNGDGTISDGNTGLMWAKQSDDGSIHDQDNVYTWSNAFAVYIAGLNAANFAGYNDWRLPNAKEMQSIYNHQTAKSAAFNTGCVGGCTVLTCSCTLDNNFWTSTSNVAAPSQAWIANSLLGRVVLLGKANAVSVRAVRGGL